MTTNEKRPSGLDQPLTVGNALKHDRLGRNGFARQAANALRQVTQEAGFAISIEGAWGSGKTSVLAMIEELLKSGDGPSPIVSVHPPLGAWASRPLKWRPRWPRCREKAGGGERLHLIRKMFQLNPKRRRSGMDRRNLGSMDGAGFGASLQSGFRRSMPE
ncbi:MAG: hypothetical protein DM484_24270 [Candidatus Methylumidiphilus alinenensis]|uniref:KAP NTPase domain-containing protein n=1 Tax=Candidatus Methylumidiphilus alinenensis TaxID=2202197 RepID=A0A2W4QN48_9GAMM|nr:MAG: hypothetical protein DM484_24270 [Candidatus Methylumidiphilus alinenensis]